MNNGEDREMKISTHGHVFSSICNGWNAIAVHINDTRAELHVAVDVFSDLLLPVPMMTTSKLLILLY